MAKQFKNRAEFVNWCNEIEEQRQNKWLKEHQNSDIAEMLFGGLEPMTHEELCAFLTAEGYDAVQPFIKHKIFSVERLAPEKSDNVPVYTFVEDVEADSFEEAFVIEKNRLQKDIDEKNNRLAELGCKPIQMEIKLRASEKKNGELGEWVYDDEM